MALNSHQSCLLPLLSFLLFLLAGAGKVLVTARIVGNTSPKKLFVFGDSNVDTGNVEEKYASCWNVPFGITYPGYPTGRFSDGLTYTDFIAQHLGLDTPVTFRAWNRTPSHVDTSHGMNFAFGGSGVFDTIYGTRSMAIQIDFFENLIKTGVFDPASSVAVVALSGNDYTTFISTNASILGFIPFIDSVVDELAFNIKRIQSLGVPTISVNGLLPLGCLPLYATRTGYKRCIGIINWAVRYHNSRLQRKINQFNKETPDSPFQYVDFYSTFRQINRNPESYGFDNVLLECCKGLNDTYFCADVDDEGNPMYTVCADPKTSFFWDSVHPSQEGWRAVVNVAFQNEKQFSELNYLRMFPDKM